jgi:acetylornithine deacetylase/succinyl-diaminopimelate desuccinylase-like protein
MRLVFFLAVALLAPAAATAAGERSASDLKAREMFAKAISIPTSEGLGKVPELANYLAGEFRRAGFPEADIHVLPLGETASLVVRYRGDGSGGRPILLMAHMDVVTAKREEWERNPYELIEEKGYFFGRGTLDIKQGVVGLAATFLRLKAEGFVPTRDLIIYFSGDEETNGFTAQDTVKNHRELVDAEYALNADGGGGSLASDGTPVMYALQVAEKTYASFELTTHNPGGHSSAPRADNAIYDLAEALRALQAYEFPVMWNDGTIGYFRATGPVTKEPIGRAMEAFAANPKDEAAIAALSAEPGEVGKLRTTCVATMLRGGHAENALPQTAVATVNCRIFPGHGVDDVKATRAKIVGKKVEVTTIGTPFPAPASPLRADVLAAVTDVVHSLRPGIPIVPTQSSGASDGIYFRAAGIPTYGTGLSFARDEDDFQHGLNERIAVDSFYEDLEYWHRLVKRIAGPRTQ